MSEDVSCNLSDQPCVSTAAVGSQEQTWLLPRGVPGLLLGLLVPQPVGRAPSFLLCHLSCSVPTPRTMLFGGSCPVAQPSRSLPGPAKRMDKWIGLGAPQEQRVPRGTAWSLWGALGWLEKKQRDRLFLRAAITHGRCWNEMMNVNAWTSWEMATSQCKCGSIKEGSHPSGTAAGEVGEKKGSWTFKPGGWAVACIFFSTDTAVLICCWGLLIFHLCHAKNS